MGYHLTILRSAHGKQVPIPLEEARRAAGSLGWTFDDSEGPAFVRESGGDKAVLWHAGGELWTKKPDDWAIGEMIVLARALDARLRGDEFETYTSLDEDPVLHPDDVLMRVAAMRASQPPIASSLRQQRRIRNLLLALCVLLGTMVLVAVQYTSRR